MLNTEHVGQIKSDDFTANKNSNLDRVKIITLMENNYFHYMNMSNNWNIPSIHKKLIGPF